jgi:outer membrane lipoprotein-sorting protein
LRLARARPRTLPSAPGRARIAQRTEVRRRALGGTRRRSDAALRDLSRPQPGRVLGRALGSLCALAALLGAGPFADAPASSDTPASERAIPAAELAGARAALERLAAGLEDVRLIRADYVQTQESLLLAEPLVSRGVIHLRRDPGCMRLEVREPRRAVVRSDVSSHQVWHPDMKRAERWLFESNEATRALLLCFSPDVRKAEETFAFRGFAESEESLTVRLEPRAEAVRRVLAALELEIRREDSALVRVSHANPDGEEVRIELAHVERNPEIEDLEALFSRELPDDVRLLVHEVPRER